MFGPFPPILNPFIGKSVLDIAPLDDMAELIAPGIPPMPVDMGAPLLLELEFSYRPPELRPVVLSVDPAVYCLPTPGAATGFC